MDPMTRTTLERRIDNLLTSPNPDVRAMATRARDELKARRWEGVEPLVKRAEELWNDARPHRLIDRIVRMGAASTPADARRLVEQGRVAVGGVLARNPFCPVLAGQEVSVRESAP